MEWYYAESGRQVGPIQQEALEALVRSGAVRPDTLVWQEGMPNWQPYGTVRPAVVTAEAHPGVVATAVAGPSTRFCSECGRPFPQNELIPFGSSFVCAACKEIFAHKLREGVSTAETLRYGGFWIRFVAILIDSAILFTISILLSMAGALVFLQGGAVHLGGFSGFFIAYEGLMFLLNLAIAISYSVYFLTRYSATPGKLALRLKVITSRGGPISASLALGRFFANYLSGLTLGVGYIMAGLDEQKRALHDHICNTRVVYK